MSPISWLIPLAITAALLLSTNTTKESNKESEYIATNNDLTINTNNWNW